MEWESSERQPTPSRYVEAFNREGEENKAVGRERECAQLECVGKLYATALRQKFRGFARRMRSGMICKDAWFGHERKTALHPQPGRQPL